MKANAKRKLNETKRNKQTNKQKKEICTKFLYHHYIHEFFRQRCTQRTYGGRERRKANSFRFDARSRFQEIIRQVNNTITAGRKRKRKRISSSSSSSRRRRRRRRRSGNNIDKKRKRKGKGRKETEKEKKQKQK